MYPIIYFPCVNNKEYLFAAYFKELLEDLMK